MTLRRVLMVSLGGTITMTPGTAAGLVSTLNAADLVRSVPGIERVAELETLSPMGVASASLAVDDLIGVARLLDERLAGDIDGVVVIQGTDSIEETAFLFDLLVRSDKPVVVTGAMRGPTSPGADGPANLMASTIVAASPDAAGLGTLVVLNDQVHAARFVHKMHTALPSAFASPLAGPIGLVAEGRATFHLRLSRTEQIVLPSAAAGPGRTAGPGRLAEPRQADDVPVALLRIALGDDGRLLKALPGLAYRGLVIEGMGAGHVPAALAPIVGELVPAMPVLLSSRVAAGPSFTRTYGYPGSEIDLLGRGALSAGALGGLKARILLMLLLRTGLDRPALDSAIRARS
jgi:L-asparaginase